MQNHLQELILLIAKLPGLGQRSAKRIALHLIQNKDLIYKLSDSLINTAECMQFCDTCGTIDAISPCSICGAQDRDKSIICVVENIGDLWALERSKLYNGLYHVLGGTLSAINCKTAESLNIEKLKSRLFENEIIKEVIIATNATLDGESTGHYVASIIEKIGIKTTRLAHGIPIGAELDHMDDGTLTVALKLRQLF